MWERRWSLLKFIVATSAGGQLRAKEAKMEDRLGKLHVLSLKLTMHLLGCAPAKRRIDSSGGGGLHTRGRVSSLQTFRLTFPCFQQPLSGYWILMCALPPSPHKYYTGFITLIIGRIIGLLLPNPTALSKLFNNFSSLSCLSFRFSN
jgi:hypothetical protein